MINKYNFPDAVKKAFAAVESENVEALRQFLDYGNPDARNPDGIALLQYAASRGSYASAVMLLEAGADPNLKSRGTHGYTALHYAAERDSVEFIKLLKQYNADINITDKNRQTPLHVAAEHGNPKAVIALVKAGADMALKDNRDRTAREVAAEREREVLDFQWQEYIDIQRYLSRAMEEQQRASAAFREAQEKKIEGDIDALKKKNPNRYKLGP